MSIITSRRLPGYRRVETFRGDTLQAVALRALGDAMRWPELVALNGIEAPYIVDDLVDATPRILLSGQLIKVPSPPPPQSAVTDADDVFGTDLLLAGGLLDVDGNGDLALISAEANLVQALDNRLATEVGELMFHPRYGNKTYRLIGRGSNSVNKLLANAWSTEALLADPRIYGVRDVVATVYGDNISVVATAITVDGRRVPVGGS